MALQLLICQKNVAQSTKESIEKTIQLSELLVKKKRDRFVQKGDTLIINIHESDTRPHAAANTLFEKISGLDTDNGGQIRVLGNSIQTFTIDGKTLFGGIASLALDNIRAEHIERLEFVQHIDASGGVQNTLNLKLKEEKKKAGYGDIGLGLGSSLRYSSNGNFSKFTSNGFLSAFLNSNSINARGIDTKTIENIAVLNFKNSIRKNTSIIGLYELSKESSENEIDKLSNGFIGNNRVFDSGLNYTFQKKTIDFNGFLYANSLIGENQEINSSIRYLGSKTQTLNGESDINNSPKTLLSNISLTWEPTAFLSFRFSDVISFAKEKYFLSQFIESNLNDGQPRYSKFQNANRRLSKKITNNFQFNTVLKGKKPGSISTLSYQNILHNSLDTVGFATFDDKYLLSQEFKKNTAGSLQTIQFSHSKGFRGGFLLEARIKHTVEQRQFLQKNLINSEFIFQNSNSKNQLSDASLYFVYKRKKMTIVSGLSTWKWDIERSGFDNIYHSNPSFVLNPFTRIEYKLPNVKYIVKYTNEPVLPSFEQVIAIPDSSNINSLVLGNPNLDFYTQKGLDFSLESGIYKGYQFGFQISYKEYDNYVISKIELVPKYEVIGNSFLNTALPTQSIGINLSMFKINPKSKFSWYGLVGISQFNSYQIFETSSAKIKVNSSFLHFNVSWNINKTLNFRTQLKSQFYSLQKIVQSSQFLISQIGIDLPQKFYLDLNARNQTYIAKVLQFQSFIDLEFGRFLLKNNGIKLGIIAKNILNNSNEISISQYSNLTSFVYNSYLPRTILGKIIIYPDSWK